MNQIGKSSRLRLCIGSVTAETLGEFRYAQHTTNRIMRTSLDVPLQLIPICTEPGTSMQMMNPMKIPEAQLHLDGMPPNESTRPLSRLVLPLDGNVTEIFDFTSVNRHVPKELSKSLIEWMAGRVAAVAPYFNPGINPKSKTDRSDPSTRVFHRFDPGIPRVLIGNRTRAKVLRCC